MVLKAFSTMVACGVVCKDNDKVVMVWCGVAGVVGCDDIGCGCVWIVVAGLGIERTPTRALPQPKSLTL